MDTIPEIDRVEGVIREHWDLKPFQLHFVPGTKRLFRLTSKGDTYFVRINFDRESLGAAGIVSFVHYLHQAGCHVPQIYASKCDSLCASLDDVVVSVESALPGKECNSDRLDILEEVGFRLGQIHQAAMSFSVRPAEKRPSRSYVDRMLRGALRKATNGPNRRALEQLRDRLYTSRGNELDAEIPFTITHGDVCARNVLVYGKQVAFTDFFVPFAPALTDVVMPRTKWLIGESERRDRPLTFCEIGQLLKGYVEARTVTDEERSTFSVVSMAYYAKRFIDDAQILRRKPRYIQEAYAIDDAIASLSESVDVLNSLWPNEHGREPYE